MSKTIDIEHLRSWIGKQDCGIDTITPELLKRFRATLCGYTNLDTDVDAPLPLGIHWCLALPAVTRDGLGTDGHPAKGGFLPPVPLPRRMWASSRIQFHQSPQVGTPIERTSTIADVVRKQSASSGALVFVYIDHQYTQDNAALIQDRQTIVYRQSAAFKPADPSPQQQTQQASAARSMRVTPDSTLLFRYSALTFNGHRIHYDHKYATVEEGYPALVVHGPLTATLLMNLAQAQLPNKPLQAFEFHAVAPAFVDQALHLSVAGSGATAHNIPTDQNGSTLEARNSQGALVMSASAKPSPTSTIFPKKHTGYR